MTDEAMKSIYLGSRQPENKLLGLFVSMVSIRPPVPSKPCVEVAAAMTSQRRKHVTPREVCLDSRVAPQVLQTAHR
jgi:hypothetical protein